jgi:hypothetical protein
MSSLSSFKRRLNPKRVYLAEKVAVEKIKIVKQVVFERVQKDAEFATDVLKAVGDSLPPDLKAECEKTISESNAKKLVEKWGATQLLDKNAIAQHP